MTEHAQRAHARLSASGADRWLNCPGSVKLEDGLPDTTSSFAQWGTDCHELGELALRQRFLGEHVVFPEGRWEVEMFEVVADYRAHIEDLIARYGGGEEPLVLVEQRVNFSEWVPDGFGTSDCILLFVEKKLVISVDLKTGKGVKVFAKDNPQAKLYSAGVLALVLGICDIERVVSVISQPRLNHYDEDEITAAELLEWLEKTVRPIAKEAADGSDKLEPGDHCVFCKAKPRCPKLARYSMDTFGSGPVATLMSTEQIAALLPKLDLVQAWAKSVQEYALHQAATHGEHYPGMKLVSGRSTRRWVNDQEVADLLKSDGFKDDDIYETTTKLRGITAVEKLVGKKHRVFELAVKTEGKPTLVPDSDNRPALHNEAAIIAEFTSE